MKRNQPESEGPLLVFLGRLAGYSRRTIIAPPFEGTNPTPRPQFGAFPAQSQDQFTASGAAPETGTTSVIWGHAGAAMAARLLPQETNQGTPGEDQPEAYSAIHPTTQHQLPLVSSHHCVWVRAGRFYDGLAHPTQQIRGSDCPPGMSLITVMEGMRR